MSKKIRAEVTNHTEYVVLINGEIVFESTQVDAALAFRRGRKEGAVFGRITPEYGNSVARVLPEAK